MSSSECTDAISAFASADPMRIRPLPSGCTLDDVKRTLHSLAAWTRGMLAERKDATIIHWFSSERLPKIRAWVDATDHVILLDADSPPVSADDYAKVLGPPDQKLDYAWRGQTLEQAELVWLARGALVVASAGLKGVLRVGVFAPTTLDNYKTNLRFVDIEDTDEG
jgi:hypothetical protein